MAVVSTCRDSPLETPNLRICCDAAIMARENVLVLCVNLEGGMGWVVGGGGWDGVGGGRWGVGGRFKGEGTYVFLRLVHADVRQKLTQHCKAMILQFKRK